MIVHVMRHHIKNAHQDCAFHNPIARALETYDPYVVVTPRKVHMRNGVYMLPDDARFWLKQFNAGALVGDFTICLDRIG